MTGAERSAIVVGSGKGGVGKSVVSVLLATAFAAQGRRVLLLDGDQNLGNLHVLLGARPITPLVSLLYGDTAPAEVVQTVAPNLWFVPAESGADALYALDPRDRARLHHRLTTLYDDFETVVVDAGAGLESAVRATAMGATRLVVVTVPEPTALLDAYALLKQVHFQVPAVPIDVLVNRCFTAAEGRQAYERLATAADRLLGRRLRYLGALAEDPTLRTAIRTPGTARPLDAIRETETARTVAAMAMECFEHAPIPADAI